MIGVAVNAITIIVCALIGAFLIRGIPSRFEVIIHKAIGLAVIYIGISGALENERVLILIMSMVIGSVIGEAIDIDKGMNSLGSWAETKLVKEKEGGSPGNFSRGFVSASILFCTGSMAVVGSMQAGLMGDNEMLFAKSILDGSIAIVFSASLGMGVALSALPVFIYQGLIAIGAGYISQWLSPEIITEMSAVGSLIIAAIGFNFLGVKEIKVANMIPAIFMPWLFIGIEGLVLKLI